MSLRYRTVDDMPPEMRKRIAPGAATEAPKPERKYHNQPTVVDGIRFDSKREARYFEQLKLRKHTGEVSHWLRQVPLHLPGGTRYVVDFLVFFSDPARKAGTAMTMRLTIGIDPGMSGAIAFVADGVPAAVHDMPVMPRKAGGNQVNAAELAALLRGTFHSHAGAYIVAVLEVVNAMPSIPGQNGERRQMGSSSAFRFGESYGIVRGVLGALGIGVIPAVPVVWKKRMGLSGAEKDVARTVAIERWPALHPSLARKKDIGRADALLIAAWAELTEQVAAA